MSGFKKKLLALVTRRRRHGEIEPDEIFLDSTNLPKFNQDQFEGRIERPISKVVILVAGACFFVIGCLFAFKVWSLQITQGDFYALKSTNNRLRHSLIFAERGVIYDRNDVLSAFNQADPENPAVSRRVYNGKPGLAHVLGYIKYPSKDRAGFYYNTEYRGIAGVEKFYDDLLVGKNGLKIVETNALGVVESENTILPPEDGRSLKLSIDTRLQERLYDEIARLSDEIGFTGGAGVLLDVHTGEILTLVSFPEYDSGVLTLGADKKAIDRYLADERKPFLNRVTDGLYTPGSIVKPFLALGVLDLGLIAPEKEIVSTGSISLPNQYDPKKRSVFNDWKAHGPVDMRRALAVSSNVYFYEVGGGFENQAGLGIANIEKYARLFGLGEEIAAAPFLTTTGVIPSPTWKRENFKDGEWRIGDTYNTSIGQYGFQITPMQAARAIMAIANDGILLVPTLLFQGEEANPANGKVLPIKPEHFKIVKEGLRLAVLEGTAKGLNIPEVEIAGKTGTAEIGTIKKSVNSWVIGFFPYKNPKVAFAVLMERGPRDNTIGGLYVMRQLVEWMAVNTPEYLK